MKIDSTSTANVESIGTMRHEIQQISSPHRLPYTSEVGNNLIIVVTNGKTI